MNIIALTISFLASISTLIGGLFIFFKVKKDSINKYITFFLSFSLSIMIGISIFDLLPGSLYYVLKENYLYNLFIIIIIFLIVYSFIKLINKKLDKYKNNLYKIGMLSMIVLILHNLPEGIITYLTTIKNTKLGIKMAVAIAMHNLPEGICIAVPIYYSTGRKKEAIFKTILSGFSEFLGALIASFVIGNNYSNAFISYVLIIVAFLMISLAIEDLFPEASKYKEYFYLHLGLIIGFIFIIISIII